MCVLLKNLMLAVQPINFACTHFWSLYLVKIGAETDSPWLTSTRIPCSSRIVLPIRQYVMGAGEAARKPIQRPRTKNTETDYQKTDGMPRNS